MHFMRTGPVFAMCDYFGTVFSRSGGTERSLWMHRDRQHSLPTSRLQAEATVCGFMHSTATMSRAPMLLPTPTIQNRAAQGSHMWSPSVSTDTRQTRLGGLSICDS